MARADVGRGITLEWDSFGSPDDEPVLLVMGLASQMTLWPEELCRRLAARGFWVIRFDNRDIGRSTKLDQHGTPSLVARLAARKLFGMRLAAPYTLSDMAEDAVLLLDRLGIESAHVVGMSMGGMIAQLMALDHGPRVRSLVSMSSSCGDEKLPLPHASVLRTVLRPRPSGRDAAIAHGVDVLRAIGTAHAFDAALARTVVTSCFERSPDDALGAVRQLAAIVASPSRLARLASLRLPTTVIHGRADRLLPVEHGLATARAIPGARLVLLDEVAHDAPMSVWPTILDAITSNARDRAPMALAA